MGDGDELRAASGLVTGLAVGAICGGVAWLLTRRRPDPAASRKSTP